MSDAGVRKVTDEPACAAYYYPATGVACGRLNLQEDAVRAFRRRTYSGPTDFLRDIWFLIGSRALVKAAMKSGAIGFGFRERLMMVVTEVNGCRYCSWYHSAQSIKAGLSEHELRDLLAGQIPDGGPAEEIPALLYARHWAQTDARPDPEAARRLAEAYSGERAAMIEVILRMIRAGNLMGNTLDWLLYRLSFGRLGLTAKDTR
jgi:AhpD family alkylhydroperoxidase